MYYAMQDANFNLLGIADATVDGGVLVERYEYTPYGERSVFFSAGSNDPGCFAQSNMSRRWALASGSGTGYTTHISLGHPYGIADYGHQGLMHDEATGLIHNRARTLHPRLGRFIQRDPLGYIDGMSMYQYVRSNSLKYLDSSGTSVYQGLISAIPIAGTVLNAVGTPLGASWPDYGLECAPWWGVDPATKMKKCDCSTLGAAAAIAKCESCIDAKILGFGGSYLAPSTVANFIEAVAGGATAAIATGPAGVATGAVLAIDGGVDTIISLLKVGKIIDAGTIAKSKQCFCP